MSLAEQERNACMKKNAVYRAALRIVADDGCEHSTSGIGACCSNPSRIKDADYGAFRWCNPCTAWSAIKEAEAIDD